MALGAPLRDRLARLGEGARPPALVFECSYVNGLSAIRSLAHISVPVAAFDHRRTALGLRSRLAVPVVSPPPSDGERFAEFLGEACEAIGRPAVAFPTHDDYLVAVNATPHTLLLTPQLSLLLLGSGTVERAVELGIVTRAEGQAWLAHMEALQREGRFFSTLTGFLVAGRK